MKVVVWSAVGNVKGERWKKTKGLVQPHSVEGTPGTVVAAKKRTKKHEGLSLKRSTFEHHKMTHCIAIVCFWPFKIFLETVFFTFKLLEKKKLTRKNLAVKKRFPQFLLSMYVLCVYICVFVCLLAVYRRHRLT